MTGRGGHSQEKKGFTTVEYGCTRKRQGGQNCKSRAFALETIDRKVYEHPGGLSGRFDPEHYDLGKGKQKSCLRRLSIESALAIGGDTDAERTNRD